mmetsp:Transcript_19889/g.41497  ORF Transcript_19889/g.41497 Transcript_19889/m.41497 type:complete len:211 (-) Transcript_19889:1251-1883(-)
MPPGMASTTLTNAGAVTDVWEKSKKASWPPGFIHDCPENVPLPTESMAAGVNNEAKPDGFRDDAAADGASKKEANPDDLGGSLEAPGSSNNEAKPDDFWGALATCDGALGGSNNAASPDGFDSSFSLGGGALGDSKNDANPVGCVVDEDEAFATGGSNREVKWFAFVISSVRGCAGGGGENKDANPELGAGRVGVVASFGGAITVARKLL